MTNFKYKYYLPLSFFHILDFKLNIFFRLPWGHIWFILIFIMTNSDNISSKIRKYIVVIYSDNLPLHPQLCSLWLCCYYSYVNGFSLPGLVCYFVRCTTNTTIKVTSSVNSRVWVRVGDHIIIVRCLIE